MGTLDSEAIAASVDRPGRFGLIFDRHFEAVHRYARKRVGESLADELAAQTFLVAFDRRLGYDGSRPSARPWLLGIVTNLIHGKRREQQRQLRAYARAGAGSGADPLDGVEERADAERLRPRLAAALADLSKQEADPLLLFAWAELSYEEIAEALELPIGTVKSRISRARARIREQLGPERTTGGQMPIASLEADHG